MPRGHESIELDVRSPRRDTTSSSNPSSKDMDSTVVPNRKKIFKKTKEDGGSSGPGIADKVTAWACLVWVTCFFSLLTAYARWNVEGNYVLAKVTVSQGLASVAGGGATYLGIFYSSPGRYSLCIPVADQDFYNDYKKWYDAHRRPMNQAWMTGNNTGPAMDLPQPPLPDYQYDDNQPSRVKRMIQARSKASETQKASVYTPTISSELVEDMSTPPLTTTPSSTPPPTLTTTPTLSPDLLAAAAPTRPNDAVPPQAALAGPTRLAVPGPTPPPAAVLHYNVKSADGGDVPTESATTESVAPEMLPTTGPPLKWVRNYKEEFKTTATLGLIMTNIMWLAYLVGYKAAGRMPRWTYNSPASVLAPPHHDLGVNLARYEQVQLEARGLGAFADDNGAYEIPNQPPPPPPRNA